MVCEADWWSVIGTWVGGFGSAAAAFTAVYCWRRDHLRREKYSDFLLNRDIASLWRAQSKLEDLADRLHRLSSPMPASVALSKELIPQLHLELRQLTSGLLWFGNLEQQFLHPNSESAIEHLHAYVEVLTETVDRLDTHIRIGGEYEAGDVLAQVARDLKVGLEGLPPSFSKTASA